MSVLLEFFQKIAVFYSFSPEYAPLMILLYLLPVIAIFAVAYTAKWIFETIGRFRGNKPKQEKLLEDAANAGYHLGYQEGRQDEINDRKSKGKTFQEQQEKKKLQQQLEREARESAESEKRFRIGERFEMTILEMLQTHFASRIQMGQTKLLHNLRLEDSQSMDDQENQVDLVMIDTSGIYIIECKFWNGLLIGKGFWPYWLHVSCEWKQGSPSFIWREPKREVQSAFARYNPLMQAEWQRKAIQKILHAHQNQTINQFKRAVVFGENIDISFVDSKGCQYEAFSWFGRKNELCQAIESFQKQGTYFTIDQVAEIYNILALFAQGAIYQ